jgi:glucan phosphoethanolaminetransferase (alkaline phosphatase superfamily)
MRQAESSPGIPAVLSRVPVRNSVCALLASGVYGTQFAWSLLITKMSDTVEKYTRTLTVSETVASEETSWAERFRRKSRSALASSRGLAMRAGMFLGVLCLIKIAILVCLRKHLFEVHWRISAEPVTVINVVAFCGFVILVGLNLWVFARRAGGDSPPAVRGANACLLFLAGVFVLLTLHEGNKNYLQPVMAGILGWKDLWWYLLCDFFFRPPFLAAWLLIYLAAWYLLQRFQRRSSILKLTAIFATAYVALCLRDLILYRNALIVMDCVGLACLARVAGGRRWGLSMTVMLSGSLAITFLVFYWLEFDLNWSRIDPAFVVLSGGTIVLLFGISAIAWQRRFFDAWCGLLPFVLGSFLLFVNANYGTAANYRNLLSSGFMFPRYFLGELLLIGAMFVCALFYRLWRPSARLLWFDVGGFLIIAFALADLRLAQVMGTRMDWSALSLAIGETPKMMWRMAKPYLPVLGAVMMALIAAYAVFPAIARRFTSGRRFSGEPSQQGEGSVRACVIAFLLLAIAGQMLVEGDKAKGQSTLILARTSPVWPQTASPVMDKRKFIEEARSLGMAPMLSPSTPVATEARDLNVVLIFMESAYNKHLSLFGRREETQPLVSRYKERMELFPNFFSNFAGSINARFAAFTGLYPVQDYKQFTHSRVPVKSLFEILNERNYACSLFYSSHFDYTGFRDFLDARGIDEMYDADTMPGQRKTANVSWGLREEETLAAMRDYISRRTAGDKNFFLTYVPAAPHNPFDGAPRRFHKYQKLKYGDLTPLYLNELLYMDWVIASLIEQLEASGLLDKTLVIITSDHGEMLGANGEPVGHGWAVNPELCNVPLIVMDPGRRNHRVNPIVGSQVDLLPTILDILRVSIPRDQLYQGASLYSRSTDSDESIYLSSFSQYGVIRRQEMLCGTRGLTTAKLFRIGEETETDVFENANPPSIPSIRDFDRFQQNFLRNYSRYCEMLLSESDGK